MAAKDIREIKKSLNKLVLSINNISEKISGLEDKFTCIDSKLKEIDSKYFEKCNKLDGITTSLDFDIKQFASRLLPFESSLATKLDDLNSKNKEDEQNHEKLPEKILILKKDNVMRDSHTKPLNILFHGLEETEGSNETKEQTKTAFENLL